MKRKAQPIDTIVRSGYPVREPPRPYTGGSAQSPRPDFVYRHPPAGPRRRKRRSRAPAFFMLACAATIAVILGLRLHDYFLARQEYDSLRDNAVARVAVTEAPVITEPPAPTDLAPAVIVPEATATPVPTATPEPFYSEKVRGYQRQNSDTVAYIDVLGTNVQYPVVQTDDNEYYMTHSFADRHRAAGAIFVDAWNSGGFTDFNTVIYGHNMKDGSMFSELREYRHQSFLSEHKYIEITLLNSKRVYKVFAAYVVEDAFDFRGFANTTEKEKAGFISQIMRRSEIKTNTEATADDMLLTLVTCTSGDHDWLWIVHAVLTEEITTKQ